MNENLPISPVLLELNDPRFPELLSIRYLRAYKDWIEYVMWEHVNFLVLCM